MLLQFLRMLGCGSSQTSLKTSWNEATVPCEADPWALTRLREEGVCTENRDIRH